MDDKQIKGNGNGYSTAISVFFISSLITTIIYFAFDCLMRSILG